MNKYQEALDNLKDTTCDRINDCKKCSLTGYCGHYQCIKTLQELIDQNKPLTLDECIKEWEEKEYIVNNNESSIFLHHEQHMVSLYISKEKKEYFIYSGYISLELNELLSKTLKSLEKMKDD